MFMLVISSMVLGELFMVEFFIGAGVPGGVFLVDRVLPLVFVMVGDFFLDLPNGDFKQPYLGLEF